MHTHAREIILTGPGWNVHCNIFIIHEYSVHSKVFTPRNLYTYDEWECTEIQQWAWNLKKDIWNESTTIETEKKKPSEHKHPYIQQTLDYGPKLCFYVNICEIQAFIL